VWLPASLSLEPAWALRPGGSQRCGAPAQDAPRAELRSPDERLSPVGWIQAVLRSQVVIPGLVWLQVLLPDETRLRADLSLAALLGVSHSLVGWLRVLIRAGSWVGFHLPGVR